MWTVNMHRDFQDLVDKRHLRLDRQPYGKMDLQVEDQPLG